MKLYFNWSSGKDASLGLYYLRQKEDIIIDKLVTCINRQYDRVTMHGVRRSLLEQQALSIGIPLEIIQLSDTPSMELYEEQMNRSISALHAEGYNACAFGDIFLEDLRAYRVQQLAPFGMELFFPLWQRDTHSLIREFIDLGFKAVVVCAHDEILGKSFVGRDIDESFMEDLPDNVDPCGENGEFHTFCYDGPIFSRPIPFEFGEKVLRRYDKPNSADDKMKVGFWFCDLIPITK
ncbi:MAG: adenine nucleotide alpha hydrolase [Saprospiraceae bacterium]|nr:adenine nucleotide alpha hydrolase [Saprospiraceae bacterium]